MTDAIEAGTSRTPSSIHIVPRHPTFDLEPALGRDWHGSDPFKTAYFNALSLTFPVGERFFIDSVRTFEPELEDPDLREAVRGFVGQEAVHRREHQHYNETLCRLRGYDLSALEAPARARVEWAKANLSRYQWLAATVAYEHLTALLADSLLRHPELLAGADPGIAALWRWHALEETEHKSVAFDVYRAVGGWEKVRRNMLRFVTVQLARDVLHSIHVMLRVAGRHRDPAVWWHGARYLFGAGGALRGMFPEWRAFRAESFHPWDRDNRDLFLSIDLRNIS